MAPSGERSVRDYPARAVMMQAALPWLHDLVPLAGDDRGRHRGASLAAAELRLPLADLPYLADRPAMHVWLGAGARLPRRYPAARAPIGGAQSPAAGEAMIAGDLFVWRRIRPARVLARSTLASPGADGWLLVARCRDGREHLGRVRAAAQHMAALIDDLLNLARVSRAELARAPVDLSALAAAVVADLRRAEPEHRVRCRIQPGLHTRGNARLLRVALDNLLGNAWKFTGPRVDGEIEFGADCGTDGAVHRVRDKGVGFDMAYAEKLFGAFRRLYDTREFPGTGIGLATAQRVIHKHGGRIWADPRVDGGAIFFCALGATEGA